MSFNFTGFNGKDYSIIDLPVGLADYDYYLLYLTDTGKAGYAICFNSQITVEIHLPNFLIKCSEDCFFRVFQLNASLNRWINKGDLNNFSFKGLDYPIFRPVYSSDNLLKHKDLIVTNKFSLPPPPVYTLAPILEKQDNIVDNVFTETFGVLPVLIVTFIGFIAIRKGIQYLFRLLRSS